jgi:hypothetical protein
MMTMTLVGPTRLERLKTFVARWRRRLRSARCVVTNGKHELYRARTDTKLYQQCLLCGHETEGWTIDRRDRRLHLVTNDKREVA